MTANIARAILWTTTLGLIGLTTVLTLTLGVECSVSMVMGRVLDKTPVLFAALLLGEFVLFLRIVPEWRVDDLLLALLVFVSSGHIGWPR